MANWFVTGRSGSPTRPPIKPLFCFQRNAKKLAVPSSEKLRSKIYRLRNSVEKALLPLGSESQSGHDVFMYQVGKVRQYFLLCHASSQIPQNVGYCDARTKNGWFATPNLGINDDAVA
jgi:hypothetical protein